MIDDGEGKEDEVVIDQDVSKVIDKKGDDSKAVNKKPSKVAPKNEFNWLTEMP